MSKERSKTMNSNIKLLIAALVGAGLAGLMLNFMHATPPMSENHADKKPLYWVAPMDSNYRRDEPGQSPMGMDLIPVYEKSSSSAQNDPGAVTISPAVVNNLGVRTAKVQLQALQSEVKTVGYVQYNQDQLVHIHPRVEGWLETLFVKAAGEQVAQGEPLYTLYSPQLVSAQEEFMLAVNRNNTVLIRAAKARLKSLNVSDGFIERLQRNKNIMQNITFYARQSGVVEELNIREGFYVKPDTSMMSIGKLDEVWVEAEVFERQAELISVGLPVTMRLDYLAGQSWQGKVDYIYPTLDANNRTLRVRLRFINKDHQLKPNMFAQVTIHAKSDAKQMIVPREAVIRTGSQNRVVVALGEGRFKSVAVKLGRSDSNNTVILAGLKHDDEVVISAQFLIDSESSKSSDFKRMQAPMKDKAMTDMKSNSRSMKMANSATVNGTINSINKAQRTAIINRDAIPKWHRDSAIMEFVFAGDIDLENLSAAQQVSFTFSLQNSEFVISDINPLMIMQPHDAH